MWVLRQLNAYIIGFLGTQNGFLGNGFLNLTFDPGILGSTFRVLNKLFWDKRQSILGS